MCVLISVLVSVVGAVVMVTIEHLIHFGYLSHFLAHLHHGTGSVLLESAVIGILIVFALLPVALTATFLLRRLNLANEQLVLMVNRDRLTDAASRDFFFSHVENEETKGVVLMVDVDHFKAVNDTYGHGTGDKALVEVASTLRRNTKREDIVCRFGGEEFVVYLADRTAHEGMIVAERLRELVANTPVLASGGTIRLTISIGGAIKDSSEEIDKIITRADEALYQAKECGRNQVVFAEDDRPARTAA